MATTQKARTNSGISAYTGTFGRAEVLHLLRRTHFGPKLTDVDYFETKTMAQAVDEILTIDYTPPSPPINNYNDSTADPVIAAGQTWVGNYNGLLNGVRRSSFKRWWTGQIINQDRTIREKMVLFWANHFSTETNVYAWANFAYTNNALLRADCLKNFKSLVKDISLDPAMLVYLNGERNTKAAPDENFSRELQELFTLGKGPNSQYTETDVIEGAKVLTGWRVNKSDGSVYFDANRHDTTNKTFSTFYNSTTITGQTGAAGADELDSLIDMIFNQDEVSKHLVRKLYRYFIYYDIDSATETNVIEPLAAIFRNNSYEIKPVLEALFKSEHFYDVANRGALIKSPVEFSSGLCRLFEVDFPDSSSYVNQYDCWNLIYYAGAIQQQDIGDPPSVAGWAAYYQIPQYHELWINSDTLPNRNKITDVLVSYGYTIGGFSLRIDPLKFAKLFDNATVRIPANFIDALLDFLHTVEVSQAQKDYMKSVLLSGQVADSYWTDAWDDYYGDQSNTTYQNIVGLRLISLIKYLMNLSEFQLS